MNHPVPHDPFITDPAPPAYHAEGTSAALCERAATAVAALQNCHACPRNCGVDRAAGVLGTCGVGRHAPVASASPHHGEEGPIRGYHGSGTIFFAGCNLRCVFCQNADISQQAGGGRPCDADELADLMLGLQEHGCHNINLVTPEHVVPQVLEALAAAIDRGLNIPIVYNTSAYDALHSLRCFDGLVDIYMPDFKVWTAGAGERYLAARDYADHARAALQEMHRQVGVLRLRPDGVAARGVLVRHLVMPGLLAESAAIFRFLADELSPDTYVNVMAQYRPANRVCATCCPEVNRGVTAQEMAEAFRLARAAGLHRFADD